MATKQVNIAIIGVGGVGKHVLSQLQWLANKSQSPKFNLSFISTSKKVLYSSDYTLNMETALANLAASTQAPLDLKAVVDYLVGSPHKVILIDNTGVQALAEAYPSFLSQGISIVTPSKKAFAGSYKLWQDIQTAAASSGAKAHIEASVGAGLPMIKTLRSLLDTGDEILKIEGALSGTLSSIFNAFDPVQGSGRSWSTAVAEARQLGFTEPNPKDDLNGLDVARKLIIFARLAGLPFDSTSSFPVQSLVPKELESVTDGETFMQRLPEFDLQAEHLKAEAQEQGKVVRYVGSLDMTTRSAEVGVKMFHKTHPIANLKGSDNFISFYTKRYGNNPLIVQGAGAGGEVTAMGVTGGLIQVASEIA